MDIQCAIDELILRYFLPLQLRMYVAIKIQIKLEN